MTCVWSEKLIYLYFHKQIFGSFYHGETCKQKACLVIRPPGDVVITRRAFLDPHKHMSVLSDLREHEWVGLPMIPTKGNKMLVFLNKEYFLAKEFKLDLAFGLLAQANTANMPRILYIGEAGLYNEFMPNDLPKKLWIIQEALHDQVLHWTGLPNDAWREYNVPMEQIFYYNKQQYIDFDIKPSNLLKVGVENFRHVDVEMCISTQTNSVSNFLLTTISNAWIVSPNMLNWRLLPLHISLTPETFSVPGFIKQNGTTMFKMLTTTQLLPAGVLYCPQGTGLPAVRRIYDALADFLAESFQCPFPFAFFVAFFTPLNGLREFSELLALRPIIWFPRLHAEDRAGLEGTIRPSILYHLLYQICVEFFMQTDLSRLAWWHKFINQDVKIWEAFYEASFADLQPISIREALGINKFVLILLDGHNVLREWNGTQWIVPETKLLCYNFYINDVDLVNILLVNKYIDMFLTPAEIEEHYTIVYEAVMNFSELECVPPLQASDFAANSLPEQAMLAVAFIMRTGPNLDVSMAHDWLRGPVEAIEATPDEILAGENALACLIRHQEIEAFPAFLEKSKTAIQHNLDSWLLEKPSKKKNK